VELSLKSEYALLALIVLANHYSAAQPLQIRQIASQQNIPDRYLEQLLATLRRNGLVRSQRGSKGGYLLAREPWHITVLEVVQCIEGIEPHNSNQNSKASQVTPELETPAGLVVKELWQSAQQAAAIVLDNCTLKDLCEQEKQKQGANPMYYI
jgi:Rrf2 family cysteine metabolism transcriptional repressor